MTGRRKPYTELGIRRKKCCHCGKPAKHQWNCSVCANGNRAYWVVVCDACDVDLNRLALGFVRHPRAKSLLREYEKRGRG